MGNSIFLFLALFLEDEVCINLQSLSIVKVSDTNIFPYVFVIIHIPFFKILSPYDFVLIMINYICALTMR